MHKRNGSIVYIKKGRPLWTKLSNVPIADKFSTTLTMNFSNAPIAEKVQKSVFDNMAGAQEQEQNDSSSVEQETEEPTNNEVADESVDGKQIGVEEQQTKDTKDTKAKNPMKQNALKKQ